MVRDINQILVIISSFIDKKKLIYKKEFRLLTSEQFFKFVLLSKLFCLIIYLLMSMRNLY